MFRKFDLAARRTIHYQRTEVLVVDENVLEHFIEELISGQDLKE
jgi:hypothetical protein